MATIKALSSYKHADHFNSRVVSKAKQTTSDEEADVQKETASVVKEIQAKQENKKVEEKKGEEKKAPAKVEKVTKEEKPAKK
jgi:hypothetical protein